MLSFWGTNLKDRETYAWTVEEQTQVWGVIISDCPISGTLGLIFRHKLTSHWHLTSRVGTKYHDLLLWGKLVIDQLFLLWAPIVDDFTYGHIKMGDCRQTCQRVVLTISKPALAWKHVSVPKPCCFQQNISEHRANGGLLPPTHVAIVLGRCTAFSITRQNFASKEIAQVYKCYQLMSNSTAVEIRQQQKMHLVLLI